jgi:pimeloyl-ACP methyl ester carboxylesterase
MSEHVVYFAHGKESGPWGIKITALAQVARELGLAVESPDYQGLSGPARVDKLLALLNDESRQPILVGSSMGGYVAAATANLCEVAGLFLLAPALYIDRPDYPQSHFVPRTRQRVVIHGWRDEIVPVAAALRFASEVECDLHLLLSGHDLVDRLTDLEQLFRLFLARILGAQT